MKPPTRRLGSGPDQDKEIMQHPFFEPVDFEKLAAKSSSTLSAGCEKYPRSEIRPETYLQVRNQHSGARKSTLGFASERLFSACGSYYSIKAQIKNEKNHHHHHHHILLLDCSS